MSHSTAHAPTVLAIHGSASTGKQWRFLTEALAGTARVLAPDLPGYGTAQDDRADRLTRLSRILLSCPDRVSLIGHSFGGAVALRLANAHPDHVTGVTLYDPISVVADESGMRGMPSELSTLFWRARLGPSHRLMKAFIDYWNGPGSWDRLTGQQKERLLAHRPGLIRDMEEVASGLWTPSGHNYTGPLHVLLGERSPRLTDDMARAIASDHPQTRIKVLRQLGHLSPLIDPSLTLAHLLKAIAADGEVVTNPTVPEAPRAA